MRLNTPRDLGLYIRDRRQQLDMTQLGLAEAAGVSRRWLSGLEAGKRTAEVGLVLRTLDALGLVVDVRPDSDWRNEAEGTDLDALLRNLRGEPRE